MKVKLHPTKAGPWNEYDDLTAAVAKMTAELDNGGGNEEIKARLQETKDALHNIRKPAASLGKGSPLGNNFIPAGEGGLKIDAPKVKAHKFMKATIGKASLRSGTGKYKAGSFALGVFLARSHDAEEQAYGKAMLAGMGVDHASALGLDTAGLITLGGRQMIGKATLGVSGVNGGYVLPNNLVDTVAKPNVQEALYTGPNALCTVREGVAVRGVDQPYRLTAPLRAQFSNWGATKENRDETYGSYTATLGTMALIYDVGKQYLRFSAGSAEEDIMDELAKAHRLGENYAVIAGPGTGQNTPGVSDPTCGVYTSLLAASPTYTTVFAGASASTILGNAGQAIAQGIAALTSRSRQPSAVVTDPITFWAILTQGSDSAGYFSGPTTMAGGISLSNEAMRAGFQPGSNGGVSFWGIPVVWDAQFNANTGSSKHMIVGDWKALRIYRGTEFRVDTSDQAGTRWDMNLVGFRGEQEFGVHAGAAVATGSFQLVTNVIP